MAGRALALRRILVIGTGFAPGSESWTDTAFVWQHASPSAIAGPGCDDLPDSLDAVIVDAPSLPRARRATIVEALVQALRAAAPALRVIAIVEDGDPESAAAALNAGAWDIVRSALARASERLRAVGKKLALEPRLRSSEAAGGAALDELVGNSAEMRRVLDLIRHAASSDIPVLITGESGTGKELVAHAIHRRSRRAGAALVPVNCTAIPDGLLESEFFGHERGAFTGAVTMTRGLVECASGGTLLLDEIGETSPALQVKLLRFLQDHVIERVGSRERRRIDVRVLAATNRDLLPRVSDGSFRADLYYRLAVFRIEVPPLRDRPDDVLPLARFLLRREADGERDDLRGLAASAIDLLWRWRWPGNVRELENRIRRAVVMADGPLVTAADLDFRDKVDVVPVRTLREEQIRNVIECVHRALVHTRGNRARAARLLGVSRSTLYEILQRHHLDARGRIVRMPAARAARATYRSDPVSDGADTPYLDLDS